MIINFYVCVLFINIMVNKTPQHHATHVEKQIMNSK